MVNEIWLGSLKSRVFARIQSVRRPAKTRARIIGRGFGASAESGGNFAAQEV
jgi:hypothetical protein